MDTGLLALFERFLISQSTTPDKALPGLRAFAFILAQTIHFENDAKLVPILMEMSKRSGISLLLQELGIKSDPASMRGLAHALSQSLNQVGYDYSHFDAVDDYPIEQVLLINLSKIQRWAEVLYEQSTVEDLARCVVKDLGAEGCRQLRKCRLQAIALLGDSTMYSGHWATIAAYPDIIRAVFELLGEPKRIVNAGIGGNKSNQGLARLDGDVIQEHVDVCYFAFGGNDSQFNQQVGDFVVPLLEYEQHLVQIARRLKAAGVEPVIGVPSKKTKYHTSLDDYQQFIDVVYKVAQGESIKMFDLFHDFTDEEMPSCISEDGIHMNTAGQVRMSEIVLRHMRTYFCN